MKSMRKVISLLILVIIVTGCKTGRLSPAELIHYMEDPANGLRKKITVGGLDYVIQFVTPEYYVSRELAETDSTAVVWQKRLSELNGFYFILVKMGKNEAARKGTTVAGQIYTVQSAATMEAYYDQAAMKDMTLRIGEGNRLPSTYHFENNYGLVPYNTILAGFAVDSKEQGDAEFIFNDQYNSNELIKAGFDQSSIQSIPSLKFN